MSSSLDGQIALVTGASRGIGRAIALKLARSGAAVICHYGERREGADETAALIHQAGGRACTIGADVRNARAIDTLFEQIDGKLAEWNADRLDVLVNNAGVGAGGTIDKISEEVLDNLMDTNIKGMFLVTQRAIGRLRDGGRVINISSMVGLAAYPGSIAYALTKAAVNSFTRSLAADLGTRGITVNAVAPGATDTDFIAALLADPKLAAYYAKRAALGRIGKVEDIADVVAFVASADGRWLTGQVLQASGGMHL